MGPWTERIANHQVFKNAELLTAELDQVELTGTEDSDAIEALERVRQVHAHLRRILENADPSLMTPPPLGQIDQYLQQQIAEIRAYASNKNIQHLNNANNVADAILAQTVLLPTVKSSEDVEGLREAVTSYRRAVGQHLRNVADDSTKLRTSLGTIEARIQELVNEVSIQKGRLDNAITQFQQQFSQSEDNRRSEFAKAEKERDVSFAKEKEERSKQLLALIQTEETTFEASVTKITEESKGLLRTVSEQTANIISEIEEQKKVAEKLVGIITDTGGVGGYQRVANEERRVARFWHGVATSSMVGLILFAAFAFLPTLKGEFSWETFAARVFVTLTFGVMAAYAAHQADQHRQIERKNRRLELELASLGPFIMNLPEAQQNELRRLLAERLFGQSEALERKSAEVSPASLLDMIKLVLTNLTKK